MSLSPRRFQPADNAAYSLGSRLVRDQQRIGRVDYDEMPDANGRDQGPLRMNVAILGGFEQGITAYGVALRVPSAQLPQG